MCSSRIAMVLFLVLLKPVASWAQIAGATTDQPAANAGQTELEHIEWFERHVRPLLAQHCYSCHASTISRPKGGLALDSRESIVKGGDTGSAAIPGKANESLIVRAVRRIDLEMPPDKPLPKRDQETIAKWVELGMPWPTPLRKPAAGGSDWLAERAASHWAWQPMAQPGVPQIRATQWSKRPLDHFILEQLQAADLEPNAETGPYVLARRLSFDLTGLPPSREMNTRVSTISNDSQYEQMVEQLLASEQFGVKWGRHWFDLVRFAETLGHEFDYPVHHAWRYRDSIIDALNLDLPYDDFVIEHLAGDMVSTPRKHPLTGVDDSLAATAWWWLGESLHAPVDLPVDESGRLDHQIDVFGKTFLGMTVGCARCHDHKFDAISMQDYYALCGILQSSRRTYAPIDPKGTISHHNLTLAKEIEHAELQARAEQFEPPSQQATALWVRDYLDYLRTQSRNAKQMSSSSPLHLLAQIASIPLTDSDRNFGSLKTQIVNSQEQWLHWESTSKSIADLRSTLPNGWTIQSADGLTIASASNNLRLFEWFTDERPLPALGSGLSSRLLGRKQQLSLISPTFEITHPVVSMLFSGKKAKSTLIIDNYFMIEFHQLLFGDVSKTVDQPSDRGWVNHAGDLKKYLGRRAYMVIEDAEDSWFEVREVRLSETSPPVQPHPVVVQILAGDVQGESQVIDGYAKLIAEAYVQWLDRSKRQQSTGNPQASDTLIELLREVWRESLRSGIEISKIPASVLASHAKLAKADEACPAPVRLLATTEGTPINAQIALRGNPRTLSDRVERRTLSALGGTGPTDPASTGRLELAQSMTFPEHPLTSRVIVNRVWHHLMGRGLVESPDNLGVLGGRPTHPELLDYLSREFIKHDWSVKWLIREIVLSATYRMSAEPTLRHQELDADGKLWSHRTVRRLTGEDLRDAMLMISGKIDQRNSGPSVPIHLTSQMTGRGRPKNSGPLDAQGRRSLFIEVRRNFLHPLLVAFDFPAPSATVGKRNVSNVPAQSLGMLNDPLVFDLASHWAITLQHESTPNELRIKYMFIDALGRSPTEDEMQKCRSFLEIDGQSDANQLSQRWTELAHVMLNTKEFQFVR